MVNTFRADDLNHYIRQRLNALLANALKNPVTIVCAGAGCGKTRAVADFLKRHESSFFWMQINESDNTLPLFWQNYVNLFKPYSETVAEQFKDIGFPDTDEKLERFYKIRHMALASKPGIFVFDNFHMLKDVNILRFIEKTTVNEIPPNLKILLICRDISSINIETFPTNGFISNINERNLNFTESELADYIRNQNISVNSQTVHEIFYDTKGWAFAVNLVVRSLKRNPYYTGYVKNTLKQNIFKLMETENWDMASQKLKRFWLKLSLIDHHSMELVNILTDGDEPLNDELKNQNAYIQLDNYGGTYHIHHLFLEFLKNGKDILTENDKKTTYKAAADWCRANDYKMDALNYYEKIGDYDAIVSVLFEIPFLYSPDVAAYAKQIFDRAPADVFYSVVYFASAHVMVVACLGDYQDIFTLASDYEKKLLTLPPGDPVRDNTLFGIYNCLAFIRSAYGYTDFDTYYTKMMDHLPRGTSNISLDTPYAAWVNLTHSPEKGAPEKYIDALIRSEKVKARFSGIVTSGVDLLAKGELLFYQGKTQAAEPLFQQAAENAKTQNHYETRQRALFYLIRTAIVRGDVNKAKAALYEVEAQLGEKKYLRRFSSYDITFAWFQYILRQPNAFPGWLCEGFSPYAHASATENFGNQIKARYHYITRNFVPLLAYIKEMKQRESFLLGRIEMYAIEACVHYQMKNKALAWETFKQAYREAAPNEIVMPFIELGKDMRTLTTVALKELKDNNETGIPFSWLETIKQKTTSYAKCQSLIITEYNAFNDNVLALTPREQDVLFDLYHGFSQTEIAKKRSLSLNTIKMYTKNLYEKLHVHKISDLIRISAEKGLV